MRGRLRREAPPATVPGPSIEPGVGVRRLSADDQVSELIGDSLVRAGGPDQLKADELGELTDGLEQRPASGAQIADLVAAARPIEAVAAGLTFEMGHPGPFRLGAIRKYNR